MPTWPGIGNWLGLLMASGTRSVVTKTFENNLCLASMVSLLNSSYMRQTSLVPKHALTHVCEKAPAQQNTT
ncbi:hypothetical protein GGR56DRAFT_656915 [Xylariaceae sp. FL0804]|nr:hypothetical protein GGR56DRAFT_656915 [Xylariaceae sp. FL0804]